MFTYHWLNLEPWQKKTGNDFNDLQYQLDSDLTPSCTPNALQDMLLNALQCELFIQPHATFISALTVRFI